MAPRKVVNQRQEDRQRRVRYNPHGPDWHKVKDIPEDITLEEYAAAWIDMAPHVPELQVYARDKSVIVEFGLRGGVSTWAMLDAMPEDGVLYGVDIDEHAPLPRWVANDPRFQFIVGDSTEVELPDQADMVMIDSSHEFTQTVRELHRAAELDPDVILLHDYLYVHTPGVRLAVDGYTMKGYIVDEPYRLQTVHPSAWGLAVLVRR